jgi:uncharacterized protein YegL
MSTNALTIRLEELVTNPTPRTPVCLCLDTSGSMQGQPIEELARGAAQFIEELQSDEMAAASVELCVVTFGESVAVQRDFGTLTGTPPQIPLVASGPTPMGAGVVRALDLLEQRKREYQNTGVDYHQPWLVLMSDGQPTDDISAAATRCASLVSGRKLSVFAVGIGAQSDPTSLARFSPTRQPVKLAGVRFRDFFQWLSRSVQRVSASTVGTDVPLDAAGVGKWADQAGWGKA